MFRPPRLVDLGNDARQYYERQLAALKAERIPFEQDWQDISNYIRRGRSRFNNDPMAANKKMPRVINNAATIASRTCRAGMFSGMTSPSRPWLRLSVDDPDLREFGPVKEHCARLAGLCTLIFAKSGIYDVLQSGFGDVADFGAECALIEDDFENVIRGISYPMGEFYFGVGINGRVETVYRTVAMQVCEMIDRFGGACSRQVIGDYDRGNYFNRVPVVHCVERNRRHDVDARGVAGRPWLEVFYEPSAPTMDTEGRDGILSVAGYKTWPLMAARWEVMSGEAYGTSYPGLDAIGDVKALQSIEFEAAVIRAKMSKPSLNAPSNLKRNVVDQTPGAVTYYDAVQNSAAGATPMYVPDARVLTAFDADKQAHMQRIDAAYFADLWMMLSYSDRREITAREVDERHEEKLLQLGPVLDRSHQEKLDVLVRRTLQRISDTGIAPPPPEELRGKELRVEYISMLAQAQKAVATNGIERLAGFVGNLVAVYPDARHKYDALQAVDEYADALGTEPDLVRSDDQVQALIAKDQQALAAQQAAAAAPAAKDAAQTAQVLSQTDTSRKSFLTDLISGGYTG